LGWDWDWDWYLFDVNPRTMFWGPEASPSRSDFEVFHSRYSRAGVCGSYYSKPKIAFAMRVPRSLKVGTTSLMEERNT
jgi:hypothetical protein